MTQAFEIPRSVSRNVVRDLVLSSSTGALDAYAVGGFEPEFVADFSGSLNSGTEYYRSGGADTTFSSVFTHSGLAAPATMTDSDGLLKWEPHNFIDNSQNFSAWDLIANRGSVTANTVTAPDGTTTADTFTEGTASSTSHFVGNTCGTGVGAIVPVGGRVRISVFAKAGDRSHIALGMTSSSYASDWAEADQAYFDLSNGTKGYDENGSGTIVSVGDGWYLCSVDFTPSNNAVYPAVFLATGTSNGNNIFSGDPATYPSGVYLWGAHSYRIDLGGMVNNPDTGDSYVPTTTAARYLPRRNHYLYNGSTYDNAGILIESAAATNLLTFSNDFDNAAYSRFQFNVTEGQTNEITGQSDAVLVTASGASGSISWTEGLTVATSTTYTFSVYAKAGTQSIIRLGGDGFTTPANGGAYFNLLTGAVLTQNTGYTGRIEHVASGWYRCSVTFTTDAVDTFGSVTLNIAEADNDIVFGSITGSETALFYGLQFEVGSVPTSYIPTAGSTVTRAAETLTVAGADLPYSATAVSLHMKGTVTRVDNNASSARLAFSWSTASSDWIQLGISDLTTRNGRPYLGVRYNSGTGYSDELLTDDVPAGINTQYNIAARVSASVQEAEIASNGVSTGSPAAIDATMPAVSAVNATISPSVQQLGPSITLSMFRMWGTDIGDSGIETAST